MRKNTMSEKMENKVKLALRKIYQAERAMYDLREFALHESVEGEDPYERKDKRWREVIKVQENARASFAGIEKALRGIK
jgi:hypothetical protein